MTTISILGSGRVASALTQRIKEAGLTPVIGVIDPASPSKNWTGTEASFTNTADAISASEIIFNATPGETSLDFLTPFASELGGKILVDVSNALERDEKGMPIGLKYPDSSVAEKLQKALPNCHVVKTLNTMIFAVIANPKILKNTPVAFLSGNDLDAKNKVSALLTAFGWTEDLIEDLGRLHTARGPEAFMHFVPSIIANHGFAPFALTIAR